MITEMTRERMDKAAKKAARVEERWSGSIKETGVWVNCELCGRKICVNNYADRQTRINKFMGVGYCAFCPKNYRELIRAIKYLRWMSKQEGQFGDKARELLDRGQ